MTYTYRPKGVCSQMMQVELTADGIIEDVLVLGGCNGNLKGMKATDAIERMQGICCGGKMTSCPDQLSKALTLALEQGE